MEPCQETEAEKLRKMVDELTRSNAQLTEQLRSAKTEVAQVHTPAEMAEEGMAEEERAEEEMAKEEMALSLSPSASEPAGNLAEVRAEVLAEALAPEVVAETLAQALTQALPQVPPASAQVLAEALAQALPAPPGVDSADVLAEALAVALAAPPATGPAEAALRAGDDWPALLLRCEELGITARSLQMEQESIEAALAAITAGAASSGVKKKQRQKIRKKVVSAIVLADPEGPEAIAQTAEAAAAAAKAAAAEEPATAQVSADLEVACRHNGSLGSTLLGKWPYMPSGFPVGIAMGYLATPYTESSRQLELDDLYVCVPQYLLCEFTLIVGNEQAIVDFYYGSREMLRTYLLSQTHQQHKVPAQYDHSFILAEEVRAARPVTSGSYPTLPPALPLPPPQVRGENFYLKLFTLPDLILNQPLNMLKAKRVIFQKSVDSNLLFEASRQPGEELLAMSWDELVASKTLHERLTKQKPAPPTGQARPIMGLAPSERRARPRRFAGAF